MGNDRRIVVFAALALAGLGIAAAEVRWCANGSIAEDFSSSESATQYNDELYACMKCSKEAKLVLLNELSRYECCNGSIAPVGICPSEDLQHSCGALTKCDGVKQCYDGWDEIGCFGCANGTFSCNDQTEGARCLPLTKLCDSVKDCKGGKDETLCPYYGGWCDGYLCGASDPKCINYTQICDGTKDCMDGSDESNCQYCPNQFRCRVYFKEDIVATSAECVGRFRVCDGVRDCINGADELSCHRWQEWSPWSECGTITESCTRIRRRSCLDPKGVVVSSTLCYKEGSELNENHIDICPECLVDTTTEAKTAVTEWNTATGNLSTASSEGVSLPFGLGATVGLAVGGGLLAIGILGAIAIVLARMKWNSGFWRPPSKLPRPASSNLPGMNSAGGRKIQPEKITHPYPLKEAAKVKSPSALNPVKEQTTMSLRSVSGSGIDSGIEEGLSTLRPAKRAVV